MNRFASRTAALFLLVLCSLGAFSPRFSKAQTHTIPEPLQPWMDWVTWQDTHQDCPRVYLNADQPICFWPSKLDLFANNDGATWQTTITVFGDSWVPLPGSDKNWPMDVRSGEDDLVVVQHDGYPAVKLPPGEHELSGTFTWDTMPQKITVPKPIGILALAVNGNEVAQPVWDANGHVWLKRTQTEVTGKDLLGVQVYRLIEDGIPVWLRTEIELTVSGKSREESLGYGLPAGWQLSSVESQIPVAVDDRGQIKAQVRAGKWSITLHAFQTNDPKQIQYETETPPIVATELVGFKSNTGFRAAQIEDIPMVDVTQTTFPTRWRGVPVYQWATNTSFQIVEKMRGMGEQSPEGLHIKRRMWIDENGNGLTYQDHLKGTMQRVWRLDVADDHTLGAVRIDDEGQLITANPVSGTSGVEIRNRDLTMEAIGRVDNLGELTATGWETDADSLSMTMTLPPGWRAFAIFGADTVRGDWLTAWSLLDIFLLLVFSLAVMRLRGITAGIIALIAFGLAFHEPGAPRYAWLLLLIPIALLKAVGEGAAKKWITIWKNASVVLLLICLIPFVVIQTQNVIYPQLDPTGIRYGSRGIFAFPGSGNFPTSRSRVSYRSSVSGLESQTLDQVKGRQKTSGSINVYQNLRYDSKAKIQTGPAQPQWDWNDVVCVWNGPVTAEQQIKPFLISLSQHRVLSIARVLLLILLAAILIGVQPFHWPWRRASAAAAFIFVMLLVPPSASAQMPDSATLDTLRQRLLEPSDAFPNAAEIPDVVLSIVDNKMEMKVRVHAAADVAVPLPGRFPSWSPLSVSIDGSDAIACRREDYLWIQASKGVHDVVVKGLIADQTNWEWTFLLKPRHVTINAPQWKVTGVNRDGVPDPQVFFAKEQATSNDKAAYDRTDFHAIVVVDRRLEIGLIWKIHNTVTRLSGTGKAISMNIPLLKNESVLTSNRDVEGGSIAVRLGANDQTFSWESELPVSDAIELKATESVQWTERWHLVTSPVWNVTYTGLEPIFESNTKELVPVWHPWPNESVKLDLYKPIPVVGDTMTVQRVNQSTSIGDRQRTNQLDLEIESSLSGDFAIAMDPNAEITSLKIDAQSIPVQRDGAQLILPTSSGKQSVSVHWRTTEPIDRTVRTPDITLPVDASNITTVLSMPENRWILWADGPLRGPAVRFWTILAVAILAAILLGSIPLSPLRRYEWVLLVIGLTQVHLIPAMIVIAWLFLLAWRGQRDTETSPRLRFNLLQLSIVFLTLVSLVILMVAVGAGLLGNPEMFIIGNNSWRNELSWFVPRSGADLPTAYVVSVSVWIYRLLMLGWALWLATALLKWLRWGWNQFSFGGVWSRKRRIETSK
ncbi:hypothetical protein CA13_50140 [Planctomycetes bacterium CA13]|uniref:Uncharacterized protein n=1 Tax=Novipirellula herctigrandis TaxID=2527986 RepID=A0A5C5Z8I8_9BACT|nr:hypothetical protein CA13_50140 [Planctomycetes bacterium CA13]